MTMIKKDSPLDSKKNERDRDREILVDDRGVECEDAVPVGMVRDMGLELDVDRPRNMARIGRDRSLGPMTTWTAEGSLLMQSIVRLVVEVCWTCNLHPGIQTKK
jgi:hypothetical protein